jgi:hypothetical protein
MPLTITSPRSADPYTSTQQSDYISSRALGANAAETITIPPNAYGVLLSCSDNFVALVQGPGATVAAVWPVDVDDGTAKGELNPTFRKLKTTDTQISVLSLNASVITACFYLKPQ